MYVQKYMYMYMYNNIIHALLRMVSHVALSGLKCTLAAIMCKISTMYMYMAGLV